MLLKLENIYAGYDGSDVLKGVNIEVEQGTTTCIVGPNGAGKSTVLRVLSGLLKPRLGEITFDGKSLLGLTPRQVLARGIVQVPQEHSLFPEMTVRENVRLGAYMLHDNKLVEQRLAGVEELFPTVASLARSRAGSLSGGQQRLVEFARCLMLDPRVILLDEPSMGLDPKTLGQVLGSVAVLQGAGRTILLVEQNARTGLRIADQGIVLEGGRVRLAGKAQEIQDDPAMSNLYLGGTLKGT
jgi:ABC-type branched-subunit amino acid transport system ATPase component